MRVGRWCVLAAVLASGTAVGSGTPSPAPGLHAARSRAVMRMSIVLSCMKGFPFSNLCLLIIRPALFVCQLFS